MKVQTDYTNCFPKHLRPVAGPHPSVRTLGMVRKPIQGVKRTRCYNSADAQKKQTRKIMSMSLCTYIIRVKYRVDQICNGPNARYDFQCWLAKRLFELFQLWMVVNCWNIYGFLFSPKKWTCRSWIESLPKLVTNGHNLMAFVGAIQVRHSCSKCCLPTATW